MHVAYVIDNLGSGGAQRQAVEVAVHLRRDAGARVSFAIYRDVGFFRPRLDAAGIAVDLLPKWGPVDPGFPGRLGAWIEAQAPDVVHAFLPLPTIWSALARRGLRGRVRQPVWIAAERSSPEENVGRVLAWALRRAYPGFDAVTANSRPAAEILVSRFGVASERVHYLPNGIDLDEWDERMSRPCPVALESGRFHLALVGRISEEKNHRLLLAALGRLAPELRARLRCWFVGAEDGPPKFLDAIRREIASRGLAEVVQMLPPTRELAALLARLDALVLPSRYEGFPNVVLEAMASRLPVVASAVGDVPSLLEDGQSGFVVPPGDTVALADGLARLIDLEVDARRALGEAARATVERRFRIEVVAKAHLDLYRRLADALPDAEVRSS
jgi:glycosyltransferase involved in cell wall biosynthesis